MTYFRLHPFFNLLQRFLRGLQIGMTQARENLTLCNVMLSGAKHLYDCFRDPSLSLRVTCYYLSFILSSISPSNSCADCNSG